MYRVNYLVTLYGLLHDIGKPLLRYVIRVRKGLEPKNEKILELLGDVRSHDEISKKVISKFFGLNLDLYEYFKDVLGRADLITAAERGLGRYSWLSNRWEAVEEEINSRFKVNYTHYMTPMLSPLWVILVTGYDKSIGPCRTQDYTFESASKTLSDRLKPMVNSLNSEDVKGLASELTQLLSELMSEPLWLSPHILTKDNIEKLRVTVYDDAVKGTDYLGISDAILKSLYLLSDTYRVEGKLQIRRGLIDTIAEALKYSMLTTPSAIYAAMLPDISLYSHSKLVSAYTAIMSTDAKNFRILVVDARKIQDFIASSVKAKAASRVLRGRSLLTELVGLSLANYVLEVYGGLPYTNVITLEGGTQMILIPELSGEREIITRQSIYNVIESIYNRFRGLWFTLAWSKSFSLEDAEYISGLVTGKGFIRILESLEEDLALRKSIDNAKATLMINENEIAGFDSITQEPVTHSELELGYGLMIDTSINKNVYDYAGVISGGKLEVGDIINEATHISLVAGTCGRNLQYIISIYSYGLESNGVVKPCEDFVDKILDRIGAFYGTKDSYIGRKTLYFNGLNIRVKDSNYVVDVAVVALVPLGSLHLLISSKDVIENPEELATTFVTEILRPIMDVLIDEAKTNKLVRVEFRVVNTGFEFIKALGTEGLSTVYKKLLENGIDFHVGAFYTGTHHPYRIEENTLVLADLDSYPLIAMAKVDADLLGEVKKLMSLSPAKLSTLSDILAIVISGKVHMLAIKHKWSVLRGPILLYAGGDDVAIYGYWVDVITFLSYLYKELVNALYPLSMTSAIVIEKSDYPLLELYNDAIGSLSKAKKEARGGVLLNRISSPNIVICEDGSLNVVKVMRALISQPGWSTQTITLSTLEILSNLLENTNLDNLLPKLEALKSDMRMLSQIANLDPSELRALVGDNLSREVLYQFVRRGVMFSYISERRDTEFSELEDLLNQLVGLKVLLHHLPGYDIRNSLREVLNAKTFIDILLLYLNPQNRM